MNSIAITLRDKLFNHPEPNRRQAEFAVLSPEMFPRRQQFLLFLEERNGEQQIELAKQILLRLTYKMRITPPNKLLYNLLATESRLAGVSPKTAFNGRDHFVHLVNLYLLGLYVFWYHDSLHQQVRHQFQHLIESPYDGVELERKITSCRGFICAWRQFVLFHDLGYPWEVASGLDRAADFLEPFVDLARYAAKDGALFALSQVMALQEAREEEPAASLGDDFNRFLRRSHLQGSLFSTRESQFLEDWADASRLPVVSDSTLAQLTSVIVPPADRISVLEAIHDGRPILATDKRLTALLPKTPRKLVEGEFHDGDQIRLAAANELPYPLREKYRWAHYVRNFEAHFTSFLGQLFPAQEAKFRMFTSDFRTNFGARIGRHDDYSFEDHAFDMFHRLLDALDFDHFDQSGSDSLSLSLLLSRSELPGLQGRLVNEVTAAMRQKLERRAKDLEAEGIGVTTQPLEDYLAALLDNIAKPSEFATEIQDRLTDHVKHRIELKRRLYTFYSSAKDRVQKDIQGRRPMFASHAPKKSAIAWNGFETSQLFPGLQEVLTERGLSPQTFASYRPGWAPKDPDVTFEDHGIASGVLFADVHEYLSNSFGGANPLQRLLALRGHSETVSTPKGSIQPAHEVLATILLHNLYPSFFDAASQGFRTELKRKSAFTYLALLCDSLQPWDRKRLFNQATGSVPYSTYADNFNLEVQGTMIRITERGEQLRIDERQAALRTYLNSYLLRAAELVKLQLSEWR